MRIIILHGLAAAIAVTSFAASSPSPSDIHKDGGNQSPPASHQTPTDPHPSPIAKPSADERQNTNQKQSARKNAFLSWCEQYQALINLGSTVAVTIFTGLLTVYTVKLWKSGEKHSERELRAYVSITAMEEIRLAPGQISTAANIKNSGQTPAYDFKITASFDFHQIPRTEFLPYHNPVPDQSRGFLGPGVEVDAARSGALQFTEAHIKSIRDGRFALFFYGRIEYRDAFNKMRFTNFRYIGTTEGNEIIWRVTENGNESD